MRVVHLGTGEMRCCIPDIHFLPHSSPRRGISCHPPSQQNQAALPQRSTGTLQLPSRGLKDINGIKPVSPASAERVGLEAPGCPQGPVPRGAPRAGMGRTCARCSAGFCPPDIMRGDPQQPPTTPMSMHIHLHWWDAHGSCWGGQGAVCGVGPRISLGQGCCKLRAGFFYLFISLQLPDRLFLGVWKWAERGQTALGRLCLCSCAESQQEPWGTQGRGCPGRGQKGSRAQRAPRSLFATILRLHRNSPWAEMALQQERERAGKHTPNGSRQQGLTPSSGQAGRGPGRPSGRWGRLAGLNPCLSPGLESSPKIALQKQDHMRGKK